MTSALQAQVEQKFFLRWTNFLLYPSFQISSLTDLKDGYLLVKICEMVLAISEEDSLLTQELPPAEDSNEQDMQMTTTRSPKKKRLSKGERKALWARTNVENAFHYAYQMLATVQDIDGDDILDGKVSAIVNFLAAIGQAIYVTGMKFQGVTSDTALLQWMREIAMGMLPGGMTGFTGCWTDGFALNVLALFPEKEIDDRIISNLKKYSPLERITVALQSLADKGAPTVFDPPDVAMGVFTSRCMRMYVGMIHSLYSKVPLNIIPGVKKEQEKLEQYRAYRISKEEKIKQRRLSSSSTPPTGSPGAPPPTSPKMAPPSSSALTTPKL